MQGVTNYVVKVGPTAARVAWHYWSQTQNERVQNRAKERYCTANPGDVVCPGQIPGVRYRIIGDIYLESPTNVIVNGYWRTVFKPVTIHVDSINNSGSYQPYGPINAIRLYTTLKSPPGSTWGINPQPAETYYWLLKVTWGNPQKIQDWGSGGASTRPGQPPKLKNLQVFPVNGQPDPGLPWKDWSQAKRDAAVALLTDSEWQRFITLMPVGGTQDPGDTVKAPTIVIPGQEWDNPNTLGDDRRLKTVPGEQARPVVPDFDHDSDPDETDADDDNDGVIEPYDPEPRNPYVPRASSEPPSPPEDDRTNQSEGERAVSEERERYGDFLEKPENDAFENRLDAIEDKYRRAAAMEDEAAVDLNAGYEQQRLTDEAYRELEQLRDEIKQAWWSSLSIAEQQLFGSSNSPDIDEIRERMKEWSPATFGQEAQTDEEGVALNILHHANDKGYSDPLEYLRDASNFDTDRAVRNPRNPVEFRPEDDTARWENLNTGEFIIVDKEGQIRTYGKNTPPPQ